MTIDISTVPKVTSRFGHLVTCQRQSINVVNAVINGLFLKQKYIWLTRTGTSLENAHTYHVYPGIHKKIHSCIVTLKKL